MGVKAKVPAWRDRFDQALRTRRRAGPQARRAAVSPRAVRLLVLHLARRAAGPRRSEVFRWDGRLHRSGTHGDGVGLQDVLGFVLKFRRGEFDGPAELLTSPVPGDWIVRQGASKADQLKALETILADELKKPIHFTRARSSGRSSSPRAGISSTRWATCPGERAVHLGTESLASEDGGGGGSGSLTEMLDWLGDRVSRLVIDETESSNETDPVARPSRQNHGRDGLGHRGGPRTLLRRLLENVSKQTSLTFHPERRKVKVWTCSLDR